MTAGVEGTLTHGLSAYKHGRCRCPEVCRKAAMEYQRKKLGRIDPAVEHDDAIDAIIELLTAA